MQLHQKPWIAPLALFLLSAALFLINIQAPNKYLFDETAYVPAAKELLRGNGTLNSEHPPLGKEIIAVGILLAGDRPIGWRIMSALFGALTVLAMYVWALALFRLPSAALWVALLTLCNQMLYVQARVGMLDVFMFAFIAWAMALFTTSWQTSLSACAQRNAIYLTGFCLGLASACKWFALMPWLLCVSLVILVRLLDKISERRSLPTMFRWHQRGLWPELSGPEWIVGLLLIPIVTYLATFLPFIFFHDGQAHSYLDLFTMQACIWRQQTEPLYPHNNMSAWPKWPLLIRPIWYLFEAEGEQKAFTRCVLMVGNPWVLWTGLGALCVCLWQWLRKGTRESFLIVASYAAFYLTWIFIPKKVTFLYYYFPAACVLSLALAQVIFPLPPKIRWTFLALAFGFFVYFFPISSAILIPAESYNYWMWFPSWR